MRVTAPLLARVLLGVCLAWGGVALEKETVGLLNGWQGRQRNAPPAWWRLRTAPVERLRRCLAGAAPFMQPDSVVLFLSPPGDGAAGFFRWRWAAYLLPELDVTTLDSPDGGQLAGYEITFRSPEVAPPRARLELIRQLSLGRLYRVVHLRDAP